jgi:hypothetical protein
MSMLGRPGGGVAALMLNRLEQLRARLAGERSRKQLDYLNY